MRTEREIFDLVLNTAHMDERIRAVLLVGSRANPSVPKDRYQDYDIIYYVRDVTPFYHNVNWVQACFGIPAVMQMPESMKHPLLPPMNDGHFTYLMLFEDGNRIDLTICSSYEQNEEPMVVLIDKDEIFPSTVEVNDECWHVLPPTQETYWDCCNEFWWCLNNVAKGIARDELPYVMEMFQHYVRDMLNQMVDWYIGMNTGFSVSVGKLGKYYKKFLPPELYRRYKETYSDGEYPHIWNAVFSACELFRCLAVEVAKQMGYTYHQQEDANMTAYLQRVQKEITAMR